MVKINVCYWKEKIPELYDVKKRFPCFLLTEGEYKDHIYGLPSNEYPGLVKVGPPLSLNKVSDRFPQKIIRSLFIVK